MVWLKGGGALCVEIGFYEDIFLGIKIYITVKLMSQHIPGAMPIADSRLVD